MADEQILEFETAPQPRKVEVERPTGMSVRIEKRGDSLVVTGKSSDGEEYEGSIVLRKKKPPVKINPSNVNAKAGDASGVEIAEGGDECWINGRWFNPCPTGSGG